LGDIEALVSAFASEDTRELGSRSEVLSDSLIVRRGSDDRASNLIRARAERFGRGDLALLGASFLRGGGFDTDTTSESESARAASELTLTLGADTGRSSGEELADLSELTTVVNIAVEVYRSTSAVLESETSVTSGSNAGSSLASSGGSARERAFLTTSTTVVIVGRDITAETEENVKVKETVARRSALSEKAVTSSSVGVRRRADVSDGTAVVLVGEEVDKGARSGLESVRRFAARVGALRVRASTRSEGERALVTDSTAVVHVGSEIH